MLTPLLLPLSMVADYSANKPVAGTEINMTFLLLTLHYISVVKNEFRWLWWLFLFRMLFAKCDNSHLSRIQDPYQHLRWSHVLSMKIRQYFKLCKHSKLLAKSDWNTVWISSSKSFPATFMKWERLRANVSFVCNRWLQFKQLIWKKKPCQTLWPAAFMFTSDIRYFLSDSVRCLVRIYSPAPKHVWMWHWVALRKWDVILVTSYQLATRKAIWFKQATVAYLW